MVEYQRHHKSNTESKMIGLVHETNAEMLLMALLVRLLLAPEKIPYSPDFDVHIISQQKTYA
jgi:hypothetical protein